MENDVRRDPSELARAARRAYELGRLRWAASRGLVVAVLAGAVAFAAAGRAALPLLPLPFVVWTFAAHRGGALQAGAFRGLAAGLVALLLPLSWLRPCCEAGAAGDACCSAPTLCIAAGLLLGGAFALLLPPVSGRRRLEAAGGLLLGTAAVGALRCEALLVGEALGLLGGLAAGLVALAAARAVVERTLRS
jgi:hypothetical protein